MITVISVDYYSGKFKEILEDSLKHYAHPEIEYELLIHDNSKDNIGHGFGVERLITKAKFNIILLLDIDAHIILPNWNKWLIEMHHREWDKGVRLIAGEGVMLKPVRPCVMMFDRDYFEGSYFSFQAQSYRGAKFDVGVLFALQILSGGDKVELFKYTEKSYPDTIGNDYTLDGKPFVFHHWYGTRWYNKAGERVRDKIDSLNWETFVASRDAMIKQYYESKKEK